TPPVGHHPLAVPSPAAQRQPQRPDGLEVRIRAGSDVAADLRSRGAIPVPVHDFWENGPPADQPVAIGDWAVDALGFSPGPELARRRHILAVPPGENGWPVRIERFLEARKGDIPRRLAESLPRRAPSTMPREDAP